ncbi:hypothetical protein K492DRAFT_212062 [Lichtheimia hyalospora FSU 10163]|nr:hypothetical protein K492DRAFT_212062 [Lichtheimia hyalospora FSU 10163]
MTHDTEGYDDSNKLDISLENVKDNDVKQFFEKGLNALLADSNFLLLYVPKNGAKMRIVRPAKDLYHRRRMIKRINEAKPIPSFYYALSHLWGITENNRHLWHEIGNYVDDENGKPAEPVSMREEKRDTLLKMLEDSPDSYWWIDVLCARSDTPLDIMGDIYACCLECIAMVDCEPRLIPLLHTMVHAKEDFPWGSKDNWQHYDKKFPDLIELLFTFMQSEWWQRVWTYQEMALPFGDVRLMAETGTHRHTIALNYLSDNHHIMVYVLNEYEKHCDNVESPLRNVKAVYDWLHTVGSARNFTETRNEKKSASGLMFLMDTLGDSTRRCMDPVDYVYGVLGMLQIKIPRMKDPEAVWKSFLCEFENYIDDDIKNKECFPYMQITGISDRAHKVSLLKVEHMGDVYKDFLTTVTDHAALDKSFHHPSVFDRVYDRCRIQ